jgi:hypothetical protein
LAFEPDEYAIYASGLVYAADTNYYLSISRITNTGTINWHFTFLQPGNLYSIVPLKYFKYNSIEYIAGCVQNIDNVSLGFGVILLTLNTDKTLVPTLY